MARVLVVGLEKNHYDLLLPLLSRALLNVDEARAYYLLKKLSNVRRLRPEGKGKGRRYVLP